MQIWRICAAKYQDSAFSGIGGLYVPGRWHYQGHRIIYTAESLALASLEIFVHLESNLVPLVAIKANISNKLEVEKIDLNNIPEDWQSTDSYSKLQSIGQDWLISQRSPVLRVPSAIVPVEYNYLFNPEHPKFKIDLEPPIKFRFDQRMWKSI